MVFTSIRACPSAISYTSISHGNRVSNHVFGNTHRSQLSVFLHLLRTPLHVSWHTRPPFRIGVPPLTNSSQLLLQVSGISRVIRRASLTPRITIGAFVCRRVCHVNFPALSALVLSATRPITHSDISFRVFHSFQCSTDINHAQSIQ